jgi:hypothetical protein
MAEILFRQAFHQSLLGRVGDSIGETAAMRIISADPDSRGPAVIEFTQTELYFLAEVINDRCFGPLTDLLESEFETVFGLEYDEAVLMGRKLRGLWRPTRPRGERPAPD